MEWKLQGITSPKGFFAAGSHTGIKKKRHDMAMISSDRPCHYAGVFTKNIVKAAPVVWNMERLKNKDQISGIIINSGNANACTGEKGYLDTIKMAEVMGECLNIDKQNVLVASTGVIGVPLDMDTVVNGIKKTVALKSQSDDAALEAAKGIMTTDTYPKYKAVSVLIDGKEVTIAGMAKGSGMIHPNMGTMLSFITTDANIQGELLNKLLKETVNDTYNMISVDGDTSTNDMVLVLANGASETQELLEGSKEYALYKEAFYELNRELSKTIVKDGEGATKFIEVDICGMDSKEEARKMAHAVITSNLVKTAFFGEDANWGRILCALGYSGASFDTNKINVEYVSKAGKIALLENGQPLKFDEDYALEILKEKEIKVCVTCHQGEYSATGWGCDLSYDYVKINGEYRT